MTAVDVAGTVTAGTFGGDGGREWSFCPYGVDTRITEIIITHGTYVNSLIFVAKNIKTGHTTTSREFGGGGGKKDTVKFGSGDVLTTIAGTEIESKGKTLVQSLTFKTDKDEDGYGPYGKTSGTEFEPRLGHNEVVGFYGREGAHIDSFAVIAKPSN